MGTNGRQHYIKTIRDAALPLDSLIHRLTEEGHVFALQRTVFHLHEQRVEIIPAQDHQNDDRDVVFGLAVEEFTKAGWEYHSRTDPTRNHETTKMTFGHPRGKTKLGDQPRRRPAMMRFEIPMPNGSQPITEKLIEFYAEQAANITRSLLAQQVVDEEGRMPGTPGQADNFRPIKVVTSVVPLVPQAAQPRPLADAFGAPDDEEGEE